VCPEYTFPEFNLVELMRKLAERHVYLAVKNDNADEDDRRVFGVVLTCADESTLPPLEFLETNNPLGDLCQWLMERYKGA